jgi:hypothetical protein
VAGALLYLDSSALVKLLVPEPESRALRDVLRSWPERVSSVVSEIEVERVARRIGGGAIRRARSVLARVALVELDEEVRRSAASLEPPRAPDARRYPSGDRTLPRGRSGSSLRLRRPARGCCGCRRRGRRGAGLKSLGGFVSEGRYEPYPPAALNRPRICRRLACLDLTVPALDGFGPELGKAIEIEHSPNTMSSLT